MRIATIGTNFIVDRFAEALMECSDIEYAAVYSRTEEKGRQFAQKYGIDRVYTDLNQLAHAADIDGVYIASPNSLHFQQAILMMQNKKHVLCEKSIASNAHELKQMMQVAQNNGVVLLEAMRSLHDPGFYVIQQNLSTLGKIRRVSFQYGKYSSRYDKFKQGIVENAFNPNLSNGSLMDIGVYCVEPLIKLFGMPQKIHADGIFLENSIDGSGIILAIYPDMQAELMYSKISNNLIPSQIQGEDATMIIRDIQNPKEISIISRDGGTKDISVEKNPNNLKYEIQTWVNLVENMASADEYLNVSLQSLQLMDRARKIMGIVFPADKERDSK